MLDTQLPTLIVLLLLSAFFSGVEAAFFSLDRVQLRRLERDSRPTSAQIVDQLSRPSRLLTSLLVGNTLVNIALSALTTSLFLRLFDDGGVEISILVTTVAVLLVGEVTPKSIAVNNPETVSRLAVRPVVFLQVVLAPLIGVASFLSDGVLRLLRLENAGMEPTPVLSRGELGSLLEGADQEGVISERETWLAQNIMEFSSTRAEEVMTPRVDMVAASVEMDRQELEEIVIEARHARIPIYEDTIDQVIGYLPTREFLLHPETKIAELVRPIAIFPERAFISRIFYETQKSRTSVTVLVNEYGETVGMVTREDLLEELVGEIHDEFRADSEDDDDIEEIDLGIYSVSGQANIEELNEMTGLKLPEDDAVTLNGFLSAIHRGIPHKGAEIVWNDVVFKVLETSRHRVVRVRLEIPESLRRRHTPRVIPGFGSAGRSFEIDPDHPESQH